MRTSCKKGLGRILFNIPTRRCWMGVCHYAFTIFLVMLLTWFGNDAIKSLEKVSSALPSVTPLKLGVGVTAETVVGPSNAEDAFDAGNAMQIHTAKGVAKTVLSEQNVSETYSGGRADGTYEEDNAALNYGYEEPFESTYEWTEYSIYPSYRELQKFGIFKETERFRKERETRKKNELGKDRGRNEASKKKNQDASMEMVQYKNVYKLPLWLLNELSLPVAIPVGLTPVQKRAYQSHLATQCVALVNKYSTQNDETSLAADASKHEQNRLAEPKIPSSKETAIEAGVFGNLSKDEYKLFFEKADVAKQWRDIANKNLEAFDGSWQALVNDHTESADELMKALGYNFVKRKIVDTHQSVSDLILSELNSDYPVMEMNTYFPMNIVKSIKIKLDCQLHNVLDNDTGTWASYACFLDGRILQRRIGNEGIMYDVRAVIDQDPFGKETVPVQVFQWTYIPHKTGKVITAERWLKKIKRTK